ncbi:MAG TPA: hypothetical protein VHI52_02565, partial [Verrucomicrobiae bacterium]|nr:hypothetical protein [Verrucomicrobiae bacterium]
NPKHKPRHHMKPQRRRRNPLPQCLGSILGLALLVPAGAGLADDLIVNSFDSGTSGIDWENYRSYLSGHDELWDGAQDAGGNPNSGSMHLTLNWPLASDPAWSSSWNDVQIAFGTPQINSSDYINFECDIKIDVTNSFPALDGSYGALELIVNNPWQNVAGWVPLANTDGWQHIAAPFSAVPSGTYSEAVIGFISNGGTAYTNTLALWIDNIVFTAPASVHTNRPALAIAPAPPAGLTCVCSQPGGTWQRQMIATVNNNYSWDTATAASNTTTYSMTVAAAPGTEYPSFSSQMFLVPQLGMAGSPIDDSIDWDSGNVVSLAVSVNPDHSATGQFQYKVNNPGNWNAALAFGFPCAAGAVGTWSLSFNNNTNVTLRAPDNTFTNFSIPANDAALFADPLYFYVGTQPNNNANIGQSATFSRVKITGAAGTLDEDFVSAGTPGQPYQLNSNTWALNTADAKGVFITAPDAKYWISWPLPDYGFTNLFAAESLSHTPDISQWVSLPTTSTGWFDNGAGKRVAVLNQSTLNAAFSHSPTNCYFGLFHP